MTVVGKFLRGWLACQFALVGFGLWLMVGVAFVSSLGSSRVPLGLSSIGMYYGLLSGCFAFGAIHVIALVGILKRNTWAQLLAVGTCFLGIVVPASFAITARNISQVEVAYSTLLCIELILLFVPVVRAEFGPRVNAA
jgi:hypothetical protein